MSKPEVTAVVLLMALGAAVGQKPEVPLFTVTGPTVIAFFRPVSDAELEKDPDTNEVLSDFQLYASQAAPRMKKAGVDFEVASAVKFRIKDRRVVHTFTARKDSVGYYFVAPGRKARVEYGVRDDLDLLEIAKQYFMDSDRTK